MDWLRNQTKLFRATLYCYPAEFRHEYGGEMEQLFSDRLQSEPRWRLWLDTLADVASSAPQEHWAILATDVRHEGRALWAMPGFTAIILWVIALGIGATVAVFSLVNAVLLRSLPYSHPEKLVYLWSPNSNFKGVPDEMGPNIPDLYDWQRQSHSFLAMASLDPKAINFIRDGSSQRVAAAFVSGTFFQTLEAHPAFGRSINANDDQPGHEQVAVISDAFWRSQLNARPDVLGAQIRLNRKTYAVIGVMPKGFGYPFDGDIPYSRTGFKQTDLWLPAAYSANQKADRVNFEDATAIARLKSGVTEGAAQAELQAIEARLNPLYVPMWRGWTALVRPLVGTILGPVRQMMWLLLGVVGLVLLIAISNVTGLLLARVTARAHELGIRTALGAARARIIRQLLTESLVLSCVGGGLGVALAYGLVHMLVGLDPGGIPRFDSAAVDVRVLAVAVGLSVGAGLVAGLAPALFASRSSVNDLLKRGGSRMAGGSHGIRYALIVLEVALSVILLTGSGLLIRSYLRLQSVNPGFSPSTLTFTLNFDEHYQTDESQTSFAKSFLRKLQDVQGFQYVGTTTSLPLSNNESLTSAEIKGFGRSPEMLENRSVTPDYRKALGTPLLRGRDFTLHDMGSKTPVIMVNQKFAEMFFHDRDPLAGEVRIGIGDMSNLAWSTVIGVIGDIRHNKLEEASQPQIFQPADPGGSFAIRTDLPVEQAVARARAALRTMDPALTIEVKTMAERMTLNNARRTFQTSLLTGFAATAIALALVGLYGLMAYTVKQRTAEIGIRLAIGSPPSRVLTLFLGQGLRLAAVGLAIGLAGAFALTRLVSGWLFGVQATDPLTFAVVPAFVLLVAAGACLIPAWNATKIDPIQTLRQE